MATSRQRHPDQFGKIKRGVFRFIHSKYGWAVGLWIAAFFILEGFFASQVTGNFNYLEIFPSEIIFPTLLNAFTAILIAAGVLWAKKPHGIGPKLISAIILALFMVNYDTRLGDVASLLRPFIPISPTKGQDLPLLSLVFLALIVTGVLWFARYIEKKQVKYSALSTVNIVVCAYIFVGALSIGQLMRLGGLLPTLIRESSTQADALSTADNTAAPTEKPDVYYIVLDRYTNAEVLKNQFNFDNSSFTTFLRDNGFTVKDDAYNNYPYTTISISSTMAADYTAKYVAPFKDKDTQTHALYHNLIRQSSVAKAFKGSGYQYLTLGSWYGATNKNPLADEDIMWDHSLTIFGKNKRLRDIESTAFQSSIFYRFAQVPISWWPATIAERTQLDDIRTQLDTLQKLSSSEKQGGRFIFAHILSPHAPYLFNADGSLAVYSDADNTAKTVKEKYVGQIQAINTQIEKLVTNINKNSDGKAVIILNSDEGEYPQFVNTNGINQQSAGQIVGDEVFQGDMSEWSTDWLQMKMGILQAVHIPLATPEDIANLSSVNMFRIVLNRYAGYNLGYLPNCHYGFNRGSQYEYNYVDVTEKLTGVAASPQCKEFQSQNK